MPSRRASSAGTARKSARPWRPQDDLPDRAVSCAGVLPGSDGPIPPRPHQVVQSLVHDAATGFPRANRYRARRLPRALDHAGGGSGRECGGADLVGRVLRLAQPSFEIFYTILAPAPAQGAGGGASARPRLAASRALRRCPCPVRSRPWRAISATRARSRGRVTGRPSTSPSAGARSRAAAAREPREPDVHAAARFGSTLPPYYVPALPICRDRGPTDGSRVEGDYINLGTLVLRGQTGHGRLDISGKTSNPSASSASDEENEDHETPAAA